MLKRLFSQRHNKQDISYTIPMLVRNRIILSLRGALEDHFTDQGRTSFSGILNDLYRQLPERYGGFHVHDETIRQIQFPSSETYVLGHFGDCRDEEVLDFLEMFFRSDSYCSGNKGVEIVNGILREEGIGYSFSPYIATYSPVGEGRVYQARSPISVTYPEAIKVDETAIYQRVTEPCFKALSDKRFKIANDEMLNAFEHYRYGRWEDALTCGNAALESILKTICDIRKITYKESKGTLGPLIDLCISNGIFPALYAEALKGTGKIRHELSSAHGRAPKPAHAATETEAQHFLNLCASHIIFLVKSV